MPNELAKLNIYQRINAARNEFHSLQLKKTGHNKFAGYYYFELGDFLIPALKVFSAHGLFASVSFDADKASMTIINVDEPSQFVTIFSPMGSAALKGCHEVQNIGAVETYQRRYLWVAALEIVEHDAIDSANPAADDSGQDGAASKRTITPVKAVMQSVKINEEDIAWLRTVAAELVQMVEAENASAKAFAFLEQQQLDQDQKVALWDILSPNSKTRSALKKESDAKKAAA